MAEKTYTNPNRAGRPSRLNDPEFLQIVAECFADGLTREQMCDTLGVHDVKTITAWRREPRVKAAVRKIFQDRVQRVISKTDTEIAKRLADPDGMTIRELLDVRKEFLGGRLRDASTEVDDETVNEASEALESNPDLAAELRTLLANGGATGAREA